MNLNTITEIKRPASPSDVVTWRPGYAWLAGGTWLFSEPQVHTDTLIDLRSMHWPSLERTDDGLEIAATCTIAELYGYAAPQDWTAWPLVGECCRSFLSSFKIWNEATIGGNIVMSLPAGPMISLACGLDASYALLALDGKTRHVRALDFVTGNHANVLAPGELLRSITVSNSALHRRFAFRRASLTHLGRSGVLLVGTSDARSGELAITVTAATARPFQFRFDGVPSPDALRAALDEIPDDLYWDDVHDSPAHRRHLTHYFAESIRRELAS